MKDSEVDLPHSKNNELDSKLFILCKILEMRSAIVVK